MAAYNSLTIVLRDLTTGAGRTGLTVTLRHSLDAFAATAYTATEQAGKPGVYEFTNVGSHHRLKLYVNGTVDDTFGGTNGKFIIDANEVICTNGGSYDADSLKIINLADASAATDALNRQTADGRYLKTSGGTMTGEINMSDNVISGIPAPSDDSHAVNMVYVDDRVSYLESEIAAISFVPYQESPNQIRLIPGGSTKTGQVYTTWNAAMGYLKSLTPSSTKRFVIEIVGVGVTGATEIEVTENDGGSPPTNFFNNYISIFIKNRFVKLKIPNDVMSVTSGTVSVEGGTIYKNDILASPKFTNFKFVNVYFDIVANVMEFENCYFENCFIKINDDVDDTVIFTSCKGSGTTSNQSLPATISGWGEKPKADF